MNNYLIKNGRIIDPSQNLDMMADLRIADGLIVEIAPGLNVIEGEEVFDAAGCWVTPGLIDIHVHLREPGYEYKEDIASGRAAAAAGGFTAVCCMANTHPVADNAAVIQYINQKAAGEGVRVYPIGAATVGLKGQQLSEMGEMSQAGCVAFSDDGKPIAEGRMMRLAMQYAGQFGRKIISHAEDLNLVDNGLMNEGETSSFLGLRGNTRAAEEAFIARDLALAETLGLPVHIAHVSTRGSVDLIRFYKGKGVQATAETAPHYLVGTEELCAAYDGNARVNPPLRTPADCEALIQGLCDGTIDCIASDHAPHHRDEKLCEFELAASGISGLETSFAIVNTLFSDKGPFAEDGGFGSGDKLRFAEQTRIVEWMSINPARVLGLPGGSLRVGEPADISVLDPDFEWVIEPERFVSKGKNTPFGGRKVRGKAKCVFVNGRFIKG
ncbi:MAG: dihydroorotase [Clostridia bacterium]|nr:dihydroorotase [Clostridia bacterium]